MLPFILLKVNDVTVRALVDTGCEQSVLLESFCRSVGLRPGGPARIVSMLNGERTTCGGTVSVKVDVEGKVVQVTGLVSPQLVRDAQMILGMDAIVGLGGVKVGRGVQFGTRDSCVLGAGVVENSDRLEVDGSDFSARFDGRRWVVQWKWSDGEPLLRNQKAEYTVAESDREEYDGEIKQWIADGWLEEHDERVHGVVTGVIPLMAAKQPNKPRKVRPVMDYRQLNEWIISKPGVNSVVCQEKLRSWRKRSVNACLLDLKKAYLQIHVDRSLQRFQAVRFRDKLYVMTRMGFGLNVAPKIMSKIIDKVLSMDADIEKGTDHYIDDIWVDRDAVAVEKVKAHLEKYGLVTKDPEPLVDARVLGLRVSGDGNNKYHWRRDGPVPIMGENLTKRELFSLTGKLVGHYPVAGWLRIACSFVKRSAEGVGWDDRIPPEAEAAAREVVSRVLEHDPVRGSWDVKGERACTVWCDASSLALGACLEVKGSVVEDAAWMRKGGDGSHINVAELEAILKGVNLALQWHFSRVEFVTDSATVFGWVKSVLEDTKRPKVSGLSEMVVRRRLGILGQLMEEYELDLSIRLVRSAENLADSLTRVPQRWLRKTTVVAALVGGDDMRQEILAIHNEHHLGVERTAYLARKLLGQEVTKESVNEVVKSCHLCRSVDPHPVKWSHGVLEVAEVWGRLAVDITYVQRRPYLSVIDCGPSRFAIWHRLINETAEAVIRVLSRIFLERGPSQQLLSDNGPCFVSTKTRDFLARWKVEQLFSCAYRHAGNGIVERSHRTIKRIAARSGKPVEEAVYWYNNSPRTNGIVPAEAVYGYGLRLWGQEHTDCRAVPNNHRFSVGDKVYVKPPNIKCTSVWKPGSITKIISEQTVEVDGVNRHVADLRFGAHGTIQDQEIDDDRDEVPGGVGTDWLWGTGDDGDDGGDEEGGRRGAGEDSGAGGDGSSESDESAALDGVELRLRRSQRHRRLPERYGVYLSH